MFTLHLGGVLLCFSLTCESEQVSSHPGADARGDVRLLLVVAIDQLLPERVHEGLPGGFSSSRYYLEALPDWVQSWTVDRILDPVEEQWEYGSTISRSGLRVDDYPGEGDAFGRQSPHPVKPEGNTFASLSAFLASPYLDRRTLDFARDLVEAEGLGEDEHFDLLAISLSASDYVGHYYGPFSHEAQHALQILDFELGEFLGFLEKRVGRKHLLVVLTSDHGVLALPEWLRETQAVCPVPSGRISLRETETALVQHRDRHFGYGDGSWFIRNGLGFFFLDQRLAVAGVDRSEAQRVAAEWLEKHPAVARVRHRTQAGFDRSTDALAVLYENNLAEGRGPDILIETKYACLFGNYPTGTSHGSPHDYDRRIPLVFFGAGVDRGRVMGRAGTVDIAPTLAAHLGIDRPPDLDGRALPLSD